MKFSSPEKAAAYLIELLRLNGGSLSREVYRGGRWVGITLETGDLRLSRALDGCTASANDCLGVVSTELRVG
jgi:hypothetical protein